MRFASFIVAGCLFAGIAVAQTGPADVSALIEKLAEPDPVLRQQAADQILALGSAAREALLAAAESDDPEIRSRAGELLQQLPWFRPDDPPEVKDILEKYGAMEEAPRFMAIRKLVDLPDGMGSPALLRLASEETSQRLRWLIVGTLREASAYGPTKPHLRQIDINNRDPALLLLAGWGWSFVDAAKSLAFFDQATGLASQGEPSPNDEMVLALNILTDDALARREYEKAIEFTRRKQVFLDSELSPALDPLLQILSIHGRFGPFSSFTKDLDAAMEEGPSREVLYAVAGLMRRWSFQAGDAVASAAWSVNEPKLVDRMATGDFLATRGWLRWALAEYQAVAETDGEIEGVRVDILAISQMSRLAVELKDDDAAAGYLEQLTKAIEEVAAMQRNRAERSEILLDGTRAEIEWRRLRIAHAKGDAKAVDQHLAAILKLSPTNIDLVNEVVPILKELKRTEDARRLFEPAYAELKLMLDEEPGNPEYMNNLAWLCARCDERLDEALSLSMSAIEECPENYAYLDTAAEANFRKGNAAKAVELEEKALRIRPNDRFMIEQLERFRKGQ